MTRPTFDEVAMRLDGQPPLPPTPEASFSGEDSGASPPLRVFASPKAAPHGANKPSANMSGLGPGRTRVMI